MGETHGIDDNGAEDRSSHSWSLTLRRILGRAHERVVVRFEEGANDRENHDCEDGDHDAVCLLAFVGRALGCIVCS
jgi:hypothetical protein